VTLFRPSGQAELTETVNRLARNISLKGSPRVLLWGHLGLGDQISMASTYEEWARLSEEVFVPSKPRNVAELKSIFSYIPNLSILELDGNDPFVERENVAAMAARTGAEVVDGGRQLYGLLSRLFPRLGINRVLSLCLGSNPTSLASESLSLHLGSHQEVPIPQEPFALIDHHPDVPSRRIPAEMLSRIARRFDTVVHNPREASMTDLYGLMASASELHLIASAPLCLALATGLGAERKVAYIPNRKKLIKNDYFQKWEERSLGKVQPTRIKGILAASRIGYLVKVRAQVKKYIAKI